MKASDRISTRDAAAYIKSDKGYVLRMIRLKKLKAERFGNTFQIRRGDLEPFKIRKRGRPRKEVNTGGK